MTATPFFDIYRYPESNFDSLRCVVEFFGFTFTHFLDPTFESDENRAYFTNGIEVPVEPIIPALTIHYIRLATGIEEDEFRQQLDVCNRQHPIST